MLAALVQYLAAGARKADGTANASGQAWFYSPGTNSPTVVYTDANAEVQATQPITLSAAGKAEVYVVGPCRLVVQQVVSTGVYSTVDDFDVVTASAPSVAVRNDGFMGVDPDTGGTVAGGDTTLHAVLTSLNTSTGGVDAKYQESAGATARTIKARIAEISISVKDFGAVLNGVSDDTTAYQNALNRVVALGGGIVSQGPGTALISSALTITSGTAVTIEGAGSGVSLIKLTNAAANAFTATSCTSLSFKDVGIQHATATTGVAISCSSCTGVRLSGVVVTEDDFKTGVLFTNTSQTSIDGCDIGCNDTGGGTGIAISYATFGLYHFIGGGTIIRGSGTGTGVSMALAPSGGRGSIMASHFVTCTTGVSTNVAGAGGLGLTVIGCFGLDLCTTAFVDTNGGLFQEWNAIDGYQTNVTSGGTVTPNLLQGRKIRITGTTTGVAYVINLPTPTPSTVWGEVELQFQNSAGAPITGWTLNGGYHKSAAPSTTNGDITTYVFSFDSDGVWRERSRTVTT